MDAPKAQEPVFSTPRPNEDVTLFAGRLRVTAGARTSGTGALALSWLPSPVLQFEMTGRIPDDLGWSGDLLLSGTRAGGKFFLTSRPGFGGRGSISGIVNGPLRIGRGRTLQRLVLHLPNFPRFVGSAIERAPRSWAAGRATLSSAGWRLIVDELSETGRLVDDLRARGGYAITHVAILEREDGSPFAAAQAEEHIQLIGHFLSFAAGRWTFPQLAVGFGPDGSEAYRDLTVRFLGPWTGRYGWFHMLGSSLEEAFTQFWQLALKPDWLEPLKKLVYLYVESNVSAPDVGLVVAQAGLELLAWQVLVIERGLLSVSAFKKLSAGDQIRQVVELCRLPVDTPPSLPALAALQTPNRQVTDGPDRISYVRNAFVHPKRGAHRSTSALTVDAWRLSQWYLEVGLLSLMGYSGNYKNRVLTEVTRVPWASASGDI